MKKYEKVIEGIYRIMGVRSNIYLIEGEELILIDTGMPGDGDVVLEVLKELGYQKKDIKIYDDHPCSHGPCGLTRCFKAGNRRKDRCQ